MYHDLPYRQIHLDFHNSGRIREIGADFDSGEFVKVLRSAKVDSVTLFAKCHHGWSYYPSTIGTSHPSLVRPELLGEQLEACKGAGIAAPVYLTVQWDELTANQHPGWRVIRADGNSGQDQLSPVWHPLCLSNTVLVDIIESQTMEIMDRYHPGGLFFDILLLWECVCPNCLARMEHRGRDPFDSQARLANHRDLVLEFYERIGSLVRKMDPDCRICFNSGIPRGEPERWNWFSHLEVESLPTGGWGWDHFPLSARYINSLGLDYVGMTGKFHTTWGEFGGYKTADALCYEVSWMMANGARCSIGDQLHPRGFMDIPAYERIGTAYDRAASLEPFVRNARPLSDVAILSAEAVEAYYRNSGTGNHPAMQGAADSDAGAARMLLEGHCQFDIIDVEADFSGYEIIVLPDAIRLDPVLADKLQRFLDLGGSLIMSWYSGTALHTKEFLINPGVSWDGEESPWNPDYIRVLPELLNAGEAGHRLVPSPFVMYERALKTRATLARVLAAVHEPYFNRQWNSFSSHQHAPAKAETSRAYDAMFMNGQVCYCAHPVFRAYHRFGQPLYRDMVLAALRLLQPRPRLLCSLPSAGRISLMRQETKGRTILHVLHAQPALRAAAVPLFGGKPQPLEILEDIASVHDISFSLALSSKPSGIQLLFLDQDLPFTWEDGRAGFVIPSLRISETVIVND